MAATVAHSVVARAVGVAYIIAVMIWFTLEAEVAASYFPKYSYAANFISDLGVPYVHFGIHYLDYSRMSWLMNINFFASACLYTFPQWVLLVITAGKSTTDRRLRSARAFVSFLFLIGLVLVGAVHGGPREHKDGSAIHHGIGATLSILGGNICSILSGSSAGQIRPFKSPFVYRIASVALGAFGIASVVALATVTSKEQIGTVERLSVYTIFAWELITGLLLLILPTEAVDKAKKTL